MLDFLLALVIVFICMLIHLKANEIRFLNVIPRSKWLSIAGGSSLAYVFILLLPELSKFQNAVEQEDFLNFMRYHTYFFSLVGLALFYSIERIVKKSKKKKSEVGIKADGTFWIHISAFAVYNALIGYILFHSQKEKLEFILFAVAIGFHFFVNDYGLYIHHSKVYLKKGRWIVAFSILLGFIAGFIIKLPELGIAIIFSVIAGGIILNVLKEELPEERESNHIAFWIGIIAYSLLIILGN